MKMTLDGVKCFIAQVVLNLAGIMQSNLPADPQIHEQLTQKGMTFVDMGCLLYTSLWIFSMSEAQRFFQFMPNRFLILPLPSVI